MNIDAEFVAWYCQEPNGSVWYGMEPVLLNPRAYTTIVMARIDCIVWESMNCPSHLMQLHQNFTQIFTQTDFTAKQQTFGSFISLLSVNTLID